MKAKIQKAVAELEDRPVELLYNQNAQIAKVCRAKKQVPFYEIDRCQCKVSVTTNRLAAEERFARFLEHTNPGYRVCKVAMSDILPRPLLMAVGGYQYRMYSVFTTDANGKVELTLETMQALESDVGMNIVVVLFDLQNLRVLTVKSADLVKFMKGRKRNVVSVGAW